MPLAKFIWSGFNDIELLVLFLLIFYNAFSLIQNKGLGPFVKYILTSALSMLLYILFSVVFFFIVVSIK